MKSIHMIFLHPVLQTFRNITRAASFRKIKFHQNFDTKTVHGLYHIFKFTHRIFCRCIGTFRGKMKGLCIAPVVQTLRKLFFFTVPGMCFHRLHFSEFIGRHQLDLIDAKLFEIFCLLGDSKEGSLMTHTGITLFCKPTYMKAVHHGIFVCDLRFPVILPVVISGDHRTADFVSLRMLLTKFPSSDQYFCIRIQSYFSIYAKIVFISCRCYFFCFDTDDISNRVCCRKRYFLYYFFTAFFIKKQAGFFVVFAFHRKDDSVFDRNGSHCLECFHFHQPFCDSIFSARSFK